MNIKDLSKIDVKDLKDIDFNALLKDLQGQPSLLVNILLIIITLFVIIQIIVGYKTKVRIIRREVPALEEKKQVVQEAQKIKRDYKAFWDKVPSTISKDEFIELISDLAIDNNIQIISLSPVDKRGDEYKEILTTSLTILATSKNNYEDLLSFIKALENTLYAIRIDKWTVKTGGHVFHRSSSKEQDSSSIKANLKITAINLKHG